MIRNTSKRRRFTLAIVATVALCAWSAVAAPQFKEQIEEINTEFHFLGADDTLLIHEEEGRLKGEIDVFPGSEESDTVLSYAFTIGVRKDDDIELKTSTIHRKYYRFHGKVERGSGHKEKDAEYLRLVGDLEIVSVNGDTGKENVVTRQVVLKSLSADEMAEH